MSPEVLGELRILSSADFDATSLLTVVLSGDGRLLELLRQERPRPAGEPDSHAAGDRSRRRARSCSSCSATRCSKAGNATLMTAELMDTLVDHSAGNYRLLMIMGAELLAYGMAHDVAQLDEKCYLEVFQPRQLTPGAQEESEGVKMPDARVESQAASAWCAWGRSPERGERPGAGWWKGSGATRRWV